MTPALWQRRVDLIREPVGGIGGQLEKDVKPVDFQSRFEFRSSRSTGQTSFTFFRLEVT